MIARLKGIVDSTGVDHAVIDVHGVGYLVACSGRTLQGLVPGEPVALHVETQVREDAIALFGFVAEAERQWFRLLLTVQGVGAKVALAILSVLSPPQLVQALAAGDKLALQRADGVGAKLAQRLATELKDKAATQGFVPVASAPAVAGKKTAAPPADAGAQLLEDAASALVNLGYGRADAFSAVSRAAATLGEAPQLPALIRAGLKELSP